MENLIVLLILLAILWGIFFILTGMATHKMAKDFGINNLYLAYIPFSQQYLQGKLADTINKNDNEWSLYRVLYPILTVITILGYGFLLISIYTLDTPLISSEFFGSPIAVNSVILMIIFMIISLICLVYLVTLYKCHYIIFNEYEPKTAVLYILLSVFFNIHPVLLFLVKDKKSSSFTKLMKQQQDDGIEVMSADDVEIVNAPTKEKVKPITNANETFTPTKFEPLLGLEEEDIAKNLSFMLDKDTEV